MNPVNKEGILISLRENRKKELKEEIYHQSIRLFKERGYENVTVEEITTTCGIAKGTFYNYFPHKEHILLHLGEAQFEVLEESIARHAGEKDLPQYLRLIFKDLMARVYQEPDLLKETLLEIIRCSLLEMELKSSIATLGKHLVPIIEVAIQNGQIRPDWKANQISDLLIGIYFHTIITWLAQPEAGDLYTIFSDYFDLLWLGLKQP